MAITFWGSAHPIAQVNTFAFAGTWEADDLIRVIFANGNRYDFTAGSTSAATVVSNLATNWAALSSTDYPEFAEVTPSANSTTLTLTAATAGIPFVCTLTPLESDGSGSGSQTIEGGTSATAGTAATASAGPEHWDTALNWSGGAVPANSDDVVLENYTGDIKYGLSQTSLDLTSLTVKSTFTGRLGLPRYNTSGYYEYRTQYLMLGTATTVKIGEGDGSGSPLLKVSTGTNATAITVYKTGAGEEDGLPALIWKGAHNSNTLEMQGGEIAIAPFMGETATLATLLVSNSATIFAGSGLTLTTYKQTGDGTQVLLEGTGTTISIEGGELTIKGGNITTLNGYKGIVYYLGTGTITTYNGYAQGVLDFSKDASGRTITNCNAYAGTTIHDPLASVTFSNGIILKSLVEEVNLHLGYGRTITPS